MDEKFFTTEQVAKILQVHPFTILKFIKSGKINGVKLGRVYRFSQSEIQNFLENQSTKKTGKNIEKVQQKEIKVNEPQVSNSEVKKEKVFDLVSSDQEKNDNDHYYVI